MNMPHMPLVNQIRAQRELEQRIAIERFKLMLCSCAVAFACGLVAGMAIMTLGPQ